ncbi:hypothetical protein [Dehalococcoides mccartyi]|nr:hypothetical protein [Dehalococcoides mccartyi]BAS32313.1 hypothetical protein IBK_1277 [Dehalococcoides mccartyi IBARAKI]
MPWLRLGHTQFTFDLTKGSLAIMPALAASLDTGWVMVCGLAVIIGHN